MVSRLIVWIIFVILNIVIAKSNDITRRKRIANKNSKQIEHFWYGLGYGILCAIPYFLLKSYTELFSLLLLRISVFPVFYNFYSKLPIFNLSKTTTSITDRLMVKLGLTSTKWVNIIAFVLSIILLIYGYSRSI